MLAQVLNRDFTLGTVAATEQQLRSVIANRRAGILGRPEDPREIPTAELEELADALAGAFAAESAPHDGPRPAEPGAQAPPPKTDYAYLPGNPVVGLVQVALEAHAAGVMDVEERTMADDRRGGPLPVVTDRRLAGVELRMTGDGRRLWGRMEVANPKLLSDPGWLRSVASMLKRHFRGTAPFVDRPGAPPALAESARIVLVGDWGSGLPRARRVAEQIAKQLDDPGAARRQKHVIHLGDVYYGGEHDEYRDNFLGPWPVAPGRTDVASYTLNGNHDMYAGGQDYFAALGDPRFAAQGGSSTFALANEHWQFLGLDTSYEDAGLHGGQAAWVAAQRADHPGRRTVLLSHHQLFSAYEAGARALRAKIRPVLDAAPLDAWFWGHEHRCLVYRDLENVRFASCAGHGGIPEYLVEALPVPPEGLVYEYRKQYGTGWQPWNTFGFAVLDVDGPHIDVRYVDEDGNEHYRTALP